MSRGRDVDSGREKIGQSLEKSKSGLDGEFRVPGSQCRCPNCGYREIYQLGVPCYYRKCPKCGSLMSNE